MQPIQRECSILTTYSKQNIQPQIGVSTRPLFFYLGIGNDSVSALRQPCGASVHGILLYAEPLDIVSTTLDRCPICTLKMLYVLISSVGISVCGASVSSCHICFGVPIACISDICAFVIHERMRSVFSQSGMWLVYLSSIAITALSMLGCSAPDGSCATLRSGTHNIISIIYLATLFISSVFSSMPSAKIVPNASNVVG